MDNIIHKYLLPIIKKEKHEPQSKTGMNSGTSGEVVFLLH